MDIMLVSPLRDGMNLVAKEFVACQIANPGVLILSTFAGASNSMEEAIFINPYFLEEFAETIFRVLNMKNTDKKVRMSKLRNYEQINDTNLWAKNFITTTEKMEFEDNFNKVINCSNLTLLNDPKNLFLLLDYDGTIANISNLPQNAIISNKMGYILQSLLNLSINLAIVSGRSINDLKNRIPNDSTLFY